jgi:hypothetical protein
MSNPRPLDMLFDEVRTGALSKPLLIANRYLSAYQSENFDELTAILHPSNFQFSHHNRGAYSAQSFIAMLRRMSVETFPERRFTEIHGVLVIDDVVLLNTSWAGTPVVTVPGKFEAGVEFILHIKSLIVVNDEFISEIRDHN